MLDNLQGLFRRKRRILLLNDPSCAVVEMVWRVAILTLGDVLCARRAYACRLEVVAQSVPCYSYTSYTSYTCVQSSGEKSDTAPTGSRASPAVTLACIPCLCRMHVFAECSRRPSGVPSIEK